MIGSAAVVLCATLTFGTPFADNGVLQRDRPVPVWGTADPGEGVVVQFAGQEKKATADTTGRWRVTLDPMPASREGRDLTVAEVKSKSEEGKSAVVRDILVGEVWFASGQSNMECPLWWKERTRYRDRKGAMMTMMTQLPLVRFAICPNASSVAPRAYRAVWHPLMRQELERERLSAVAFYYARELHLALGVPIGIVTAAAGGTSIDLWTPREKDEKPTLFNGMVAAWTPMAMRGFIWYQGCANQLHDDPTLYCGKMHALYDGWKKAFENKDLRLYFAQLAPYGAGWLPLVTQQNRFAAEEPNAALAVLSDVGNRDDIHPNDKETVAQRLALIALKRDYGFDIPEDTAPTFRSATAETNGVVTLRFDHVKNWYVYADSGSKDVAFELAGTNGVWRVAKVLNFVTKPKNGWADENRIVSPEIRLGSKGLSAPVAVRYMGRGQYGTLFADTSLPLGAFSAKIETGE